MRVAERHRLRLAINVGARCDGHPLCPSSSDHSRDRVGGGGGRFLSCHRSAQPIGCCVPASALVDRPPDLPAGRDQQMGVPCAWVTLCRQRREGFPRSVSQGSAPFPPNSALLSGRTSLGGRGPRRESRCGSAGASPSRWRRTLRLSVAGALVESEAALRRSCRSATEIPTTEERLVRRVCPVG